jgi:uncharacterized protein (DUF2141 family)
MTSLARAATVEVDVGNVKRAGGHVRATLCTEATFLKSDCAYEASAPAQVGETAVTFTGVAPGRYAAQVFDDDTDAGKVHQDKLGVPREGVGFSNDAPIHVKGPRFHDAAFDVGQETVRVRATLHYFARGSARPAQGEEATPVPER